MNPRTTLAALAVMATIALTTPTYCDSRAVFHSQGHLTPRQNVYYHFFQFSNPSSTVGLLGPIRTWETSNATLRGLIWLKADDEGDFWTGLGFWPTLSITHKTSVTVDLRYLFGWSDTLNQLQVIPWVDYSLNDRNTVRLQAGLTENLGDEVSQPWSLGPFWIYDLGGGRQFRLGYQQTIEGATERQFIVAYNFNL